MGNLIVIEGLDGSGKATQTQLLSDYMKARGISHRQVTFPDYSSPASAPVKMYLAGELGRVEEVGPYAASSLYAVDRYVSYKTQWEQDYRSGTLILADRYSTSNAIYQMAKLPEDRWPEFLDWYWDYEFSKMELPPPTQVIYLDVDPEVSRQLMLERYQGDPEKMDIHESNMAYLLACRQAAFFAMKKWDWIKIDCTKQGAMLPPEQIAAEIRHVLALD